jgi:hypothetical protein
MRASLFQRDEDHVRPPFSPSSLTQTSAHSQQILLVSHGAIAHFITEDWQIADPMLGTNWSNCEVRDFTFSAESKDGDAHLVETEESLGRRPPYVGPVWEAPWDGVRSGDKDGHVVEEVREVEPQVVEG